MPRGDRTGPAGMGAMTGRAAGYCAGNAMPGFMTPGFGSGLGIGMGRGRGRGFGMGMGRRHGWAGAPYPVAAYPAPIVPPATPMDEVEALKNQAHYFAEALEGINRRITELDNKKHNE